jgi:hypothetical protein
MTQNIFNLYSSVVYSEHPLALWNLDEDFSFLSLVGASPVWSIVNGSSGSISNPPAFKPQETVGIAEEFLELDNFIASASTMTITAQSFSVPQDIDIEKSTVCFNSFLYSYESEITELKIGFSVGSELFVKTYENISKNSWTRISHTMILPDSGTVVPYLQISFNGSERNVSLYKSSVGQWSENYNHESVGAVPFDFSLVPKYLDIASSIGGSISASPQNFKVVLADSYGFEGEKDGYYFIENNKMLARNTNLPMVFGSADITEVYPSESSNPSIVCPGQGFLHFDGRNKNYTAEFWLKIYPDSQDQLRIFGPLASKDGLYVDREFLTLKVGPYEKSYFIHKWYRPMLVHLRYSNKFISVLINGDVVIEQEIFLPDITWPNSSAFNTDWLGFYSHPDIIKMEIDSFAIFPYEISEQLAKKNFVYGQGVGQPNEITTRFGGPTHTIDFAFANYTNNLMYPDMTNWSAGFYSNISADARTISLPNYELAEIIYLGDTDNLFEFNRAKRSWRSVLDFAEGWQTWTSTTWGDLARSRELDPFLDSFLLQADSDEKPYIKIKPSSAYQDVYGSVDFESLSVLNDSVTSFISLLSYSDLDFDDNEEMILAYMLNKETQDVVQIILNVNTNTILYLYNDTLLKSIPFNINNVKKYFIVGFDIEQLSLSYSTILRNFFSVPQNIEIKVGGNDTNQFSGRIYNIHFNNKFFNNKDISGYFDENGIAQVNGSAEVLDNDFIVDYIGNYSLLFKKTNSNIIMDIGSQGYWEDSIPLSRLGSFINTSKARQVYDLDLIQFNIDYPSSAFVMDNFDKEEDVQAYISLQRFEDVGGIAYSNFSNTKNLNGKKYIDFEDITTNIDTTKFRVVDGTVIFPPKRIINFANAYVTVHLEMRSHGIKTEPIALQGLALTSLAVDESSLYPINTTTGNDIFPFTRTGQSYSPKIKNPFAISKESIPYLYLTADSGITAIPYPDIDEKNINTVGRGISFPINPQRNEEYEFYGSSLWFAYNNNNAIDTRKKIMSLYTQEKRYNFYLEPEKLNKRGKFVVYEANGIGIETLSDDFDIFENGIKKEVYVRPLTWLFLAIVPKSSINLNNIVGQLETYPGIIANNVTFYEKSLDKKIDDIFESHLGLSNIVVQDPSSILIQSDSTRVDSNISWATFSGKPL